MGLLDLIRAQRLQETRFTQEDRDAILKIEVQPKSDKEKYPIVRFFRKDGTQEDFPRSYRDQDLEIGTELDKNKCIKVYEKGYVCIHYEGMDFVPDWVTVSEIPLQSFYSARIKSIQAVPEDNGLELKITFENGIVKNKRISNQSRELSNYEFVSPEDCLMVKMRKYHTRFFPCVKVVDHKAE